MNIKKMIFIIMTSFFYLSICSARSLRATADKLGQEASQIGFGLALFGLAIGGTYLILGKQDAPAKITNTLLGILVLSASPTIVKFIKSVA